MTRLRAHSPWPLLAAALLLLAVDAAASDATRLDSMQQARAAANAGDAAGAVALYDVVLAGNPDDIEALRESAQQLSWSKEYAAAVARYERVLVLEPTDRFALRERAKVLGWAGRYEEATRAFDTFLRIHPDDLEGRIGYARVLSWSGRLGAARDEYLAVLGDHPDQADALLGVAQTFAWSGDLQEARRRYEAATRVASDPKDAMIGLAYLDIWQGAPGKALATAVRLDDRHPGDADVQALMRAARAATAPWLTAGWDRLDDTDDNTIETLRFEAGLWLPPGVRTRLTYNDHDIASGNRRGTIRSLQAHAEWVPRPGHRLDTMVGVDRLEGPAATRADVTDWGLGYRLPLFPGFDGWIAARREPYRYSVALIDNRIVVDSYTAGVSGRIADHWYLAGEAGTWHSSDGNRRWSTDFSARRRWQQKTHTFEAGGNLRWLDWDEEPDNGYFSPGDFTSAGVLGRAFGPLGDNASLDYDIYLEAGLQSYDYRGARTSSDPYYLLVARLGWVVTEAARLELFGEAGSYASQGSEDWRYSRAGLRLVWRAGAGR